MKTTTLAHEYGSNHYVRQIITVGPIPLLIQFLECHDPFCRNFTRYKESASLADDVGCMG